MRRSILFKGVRHSCEYGVDDWLYARIVDVAAENNAIEEALDIPPGRLYFARSATDRWPGEPKHAQIIEVVLVPRCALARRERQDIIHDRMRMLDDFCREGRWEIEERSHGGNGMILVNIPSPHLPMVLYLSSKEGKVGIVMSSDKVKDAMAPFLSKIGASLRSNGIIILPLKRVSIETRNSMYGATFMRIDSPNGALIIHDLFGEFSQTEEHHMHFSPGLSEIALAVQDAIDKAGKAAVAESIETQLANAERDMFLAAPGETA